MAKSKKRPDFITDEHLEYLDNLRTSGEINMFGATAYLEDEFSIERSVARKITTYWMATFGRKNR